MVASEQRDSYVVGLASLGWVQGPHENRQRGRTPQGVEGLCLLLWVAKPLHAALPTPMKPLDLIYPSPFVQSCRPRCPVHLSTPYSQSISIYIAAVKVKAHPQVRHQLHQAGHSSSGRLRVRLCSLRLQLHQCPGHLLDVLQVQAGQVVLVDLARAREGERDG